MLKKLDYKWVIVALALGIVVIVIVFSSAIESARLATEKSENCKQECVAAEFNANEECDDKSTNRIAGMDAACCCI